MKRYLKLFFAILMAMFSLTACVNTPTTSRSSEESEFILAESSEKRIDESLLTNLNHEQLVYALNEIYARHGKIFDDDVYNKYISAKKWYRPNPNFSEKILNDIELYNIELISDYIEKTDASDTTTEAETELHTEAQHDSQQEYTRYEAVKSDYLKESRDEINNLLLNYCYSLCDAINFGDYSIVEYCIADGSPLETMQRKLVKNLFDKGTSESFEDLTIKNMEFYNDDKFCKIDVEESETIYYASGKTEKKTYDWTYTAKYNGYEWRLSNIE